MKKRLLLSLSGGLTLYVVSYLFLTMHGRYVWHARGDLRMKNKDGSLGLSLYDTVIWLPKYIDLRTTILYPGEHHIFWNVGGVIYSPLIYLDRKWWHKTVDLLAK